MRVLAVLFLLFVCLPLQTYAGAACVVAKEKGNSLAFVVEVGAAPGADLVVSGVKKLWDQGHEGAFSQATTNLKHAHVAIIRTRYKTFTGRIRTSYGCGFSNQSPKQAEQFAVLDLVRYSWAWKPEYGYEVLQRSRF